jgi:ankyrin repeat protein
LHNAVIHNHIEIVRLLLETGADGSIKNKKGQTALDLAQSQEIRDLILSYTLPIYKEPE